ncbi:hypothetical protein GGR56DRAFT_635556 [Xylariaceae sp. FL0804]|nr:hypothetical protein GGR56DRAFT_635556 [Xylariaceae sp. FL0804]
MAQAQNSFEFVVVGGGPAGCAVAAGLANWPTKPSVLLLEAGGDNADRDLRVSGQRFTTFMNKDLNWGYKTTPQENAAGRELDYSRGKGLGGSSAINFGVFSRGARDDYDEWARLVGDESFDWKHMLPRFRNLESFDPNLPEDVVGNYSAPSPSDHGTYGPLKVSYAKEWEEDFSEMLDIFEDAGWPLNPDHNSGNILGMAPVINSSHGGIRSTANDLLKPQPENLTIVTGAPVQRLILEGPKAVGCVDAKGKQYRATKEVILSAGALNSPSILMHSGIGPAKQLEEFKIPVVRDVPAIGQGLRDHQFVPLVYTRTDTSTSRASFYGDAKAMADAMQQWKLDGSGAWSKYASELAIGWKKIDGLESTPEFQALSKADQDFLRRETIPHYELISHYPIHLLIPDFPAANLNYSCFLIFPNGLSRGQVSLQSADPSVPLKFDPNFLGTEFNRKVSIQCLREVMEFTKHPRYAKDTTGVMIAPKSDSDEDLLAYWQQMVGSSWHMTGTVPMGSSENAAAPLDTGFRVKGIEGLRVADLSSAPVLGSCHVQAMAYVTGMTCADKLVDEYYKYEL